jgi:hypothetical protein
MFATTNHYKIRSLLLCMQLGKSWGLAKLLFEGTAKANRAHSSSIFRPSSGRKVWKNGA